MSQVFQNLVDNALKYGPAGQTLSVSCRHLQSSLELVVADQGPGISPADSERVFDPFYRIPSANRSVRGNGLGLHGVKVLCQAMGGEIRLETGPEGGCRFRVRLPLNTPERQPNGEPNS